VIAIPYAEEATEAHDCVFGLSGALVDHVDYNPPPSLGIGIGGFGFNGCCAGFGSGLGVGLPLGKPTPSHVSDQYIASAIIPVPGNYIQSWAGFHLEVQVGNRPLVVAAPAPSVG
jgi:hypothetical protein